MFLAGTVRIVLFCLERIPFKANRSELSNSCGTTGCALRSGDGADDRLNDRTGLLDHLRAIGVGRQHQEVSVLLPVS